MNINEIIPKTQISTDLSTKIWTTSSINQVLENLDKVTNFMQNSLWWKNSRLSSYAIPTWFCLLNNEKLTDKLLNNGFFIDYLNNTPIGGHKNIVKMSSISNNETVLTNLENMPYLFNFEAKSIKKLIDFGMKVDYSIFSGAREYPKYALDIIKLNILPFDENKIVNAGSFLYANESIVNHTDLKDGASWILLAKTS